MELSCLYIPQEHYFKSALWLSSTVENVKNQFSAKSTFKIQKYWVTLHFGQVL